MSWYILILLTYFTDLSIPSNLTLTFSWVLTLFISTWNTDTIMKTRTWIARILYKIQCAFYRSIFIKVRIVSMILYIDINDYCYFLHNRLHSIRARRSTCIQNRYLYFHKYHVHCNPSGQQDHRIHLLNC